MILVMSEHSQVSRGLPQACPEACVVFGLQCSCGRLLEACFKACTTRVMLFHTHKITEQLRKQSGRGQQRRVLQVGIAIDVATTDGGLLNALAWHVKFMHYFYEFVYARALGVFV